MTPSKRRTTEVRGWVNFPIQDPTWNDTREGGMFVRLVVEEPDCFAEMACCGGNNWVILDETLPRDVQREHFPRSEEASKSEEEDARLLYLKYMSIPYIAVLTIGSTGWSGWGKKTEAYWRCQFEDLTEEGKELYRSLQKLYPKSRLSLLTFLDT
jgi:hypothetical protein